LPSHCDSHDLHNSNPRPGVVITAPRFKKGKKKPSLLNQEEGFRIDGVHDDTGFFFIVNPSWPHRTRLKENFCNAVTIPQLVLFCQDNFHVAGDPPHLASCIHLSVLIVFGGCPVLSSSSLSCSICASPDVFHVPKLSSVSSVYHEGCADSPDEGGDDHAVGEAELAALCGAV
jgi:hypothetical protein